MPQRPLSLVSLVLALFVGVGVGTRGGPATAISNTGEKTSGAGRSAGQNAAHTVHHNAAKETPTQGQLESECDAAAQNKAPKAKDALKACAPALPPVQRTLCRLNPAFSRDEKLRHNSELAEIQPAHRGLMTCLSGLDIRISSIVASVPDPDHTHLGLLTDRTLDAIQSAAAQAGYDPYSHYFPWDPSQPPQTSENTPASETNTDSHQPGLLMFRSDSPSTHYLAVFLIAELPTTGLDEQAFFAAKAIMDRIPDSIVSPSKQLASKTIYLAGPNFSGSVSSLGDIDGELGKTQCIHAYSGQVTAAGYIKRKPSKIGEGCISTLYPTQTRDCEAIPLFVQSAESFYGYRSTEIAVLSEAGTAFGNSVGDSGRQEASDARAQEPPCPPRANLLYLQFPREIAKLRNAYGAAASHPAPASTTNQQAPDVALSWQDSQATRGDDVPVYGGEQTPFSQEAVLASLASDMKDRKIKALGIMATDPMDEAFLLRSFRKALPDVRLFLRDPDLLYLQTPDAGSLNGVLLVNDFPLLPQNQSWSRATLTSGTFRDDLVAFPSAAQEAQYNAFLLMLNDLDGKSRLPPGLLEWNWPAGVAGLCMPTQPMKSLHPLWLTTIGTSGHFPLAVLKESSIDAQQCPLETLDVGGPSYASVLLWLSAAMLGILHVLALTWPSALPRAIGSDFDLGDASDTITAAKAFCHVAMLLILALIEIVLGSSYLYFHQTQPQFEWLGRGVIFTATLLFVTACGVFAARVAWPWWQWRKQATLSNQQIVPVWRPLFSSIFCVAIFATIGVLWMQGAFGEKFSSPFLSFRDLKIYSGVAPSLPIVLLLTIIYLGTWAYARRLACWVQWRPPIPNLPLDEVLPSNFQTRTWGIDKCIVSFLENDGWTAVFFVIVGLGIGNFILRNNLDMLEIHTIRWVGEMLFALAFFTLMLNWFRFMNIWSLLRSVLSGLERLPIHHAFARMPAEKSMPIWQWGTSDYSTLASTQGIERLRALLDEDATLVDALSYADVRSKIKDLGKFNDRRKGIWELLFLLLQPPKMELVALAPAADGTSVVTSGYAGSSRWQGKSIPNRLGGMLAAARQSMITILDQLIYFPLTAYWKRGSDGSDATTDAKSDRIAKLAEDVVALRYYIYIRYVVAELRSLLFFVVLAFSLLFLTFHVYAFRTDEAIDWSFLILFLVLGCGVITVLYQMELDPILSHLGGGKPGEVGLSFYVDLLKYGALPLMTIIGSQVPAVSNVLLKWVQPALQSMR